MTSHGMFQLHASVSPSIEWKARKAKASQLQRNITVGKAVTARGAQWDLILPHPRATFLPKRAVLSVPGLRTAGSWGSAVIRQSHRSSDEGEEPVNS